MLVFDERGKAEYLAGEKEESRVSEKERDFI